MRKIKESVMGSGWLIKISTATKNKLTNKEIIKICALVDLICWNFILPFVNANLHELQ